MAQKFLGPLVGVVAIGLAIYGITNPPSVVIGDDTPGLFGSVGTIEYAKTGENIEKLVPEALVKANRAKVSSDYLAKKDYILVYFTAHWCPPCRKFTPKLVEFYNKHAKSGNFETILVSSDRNENDMFKYMQEAKMPWVAVPFADRRGKLAAAYAKSGIPNLVLIKPDGTVISASYQGNRYLGPNKVLNDFAKILKDEGKS